MQLYYIILTNMCNIKHRKPFFSPNVLKRWYFQKNCAGIWSFMYYRERWYFFFLKIWSYTLNRKWKVSFFKNTRKYDIFFKLSEKMVFPKRAAPAHDLSCIIWKDGIFSRKQIFSSGRKWNEAFLRKYMEGWYIALQRRKIGNLIYRIDVWLLLKFIRLEIFYILNFQYFVPFSNQELCLEVCLSANKGNYLSIREQVVIPKM